MKAFLTFSVMGLMVVGSVMAQERTAGQNYDAQVNWSALKTSIDLVSNQNKILAQTLDKYNTCSAKTMLFVQSAVSADNPDGCVALGGGAPNAVLEDEKPSGTEGGDNSVNVWITRTLNTKAYDPDNMITLAANQFKPATNAWVEWSCPGYTVGSHQTRLFNVTDGTVVSYGTSTYSSASATDSRSEGGAGLIAGKTYRIEHWLSGRHTSGGQGQGLGHFGATGNVQVYCRAKIWKS